MWGLAFFAFIISICCYLGIREHTITNTVLSRYAQSLEKKKEQDKTPFIFVDPDETESLRKRLENEGQDESTELNAIMAETDQEEEEYFW